MTNTSIILRVELQHEKATFGDVASAISAAGGDIISTDVIRPGKDSSIRDVSDRTFLAHLGGKITIQPILPIKNRDDLGRVYTPGVAKVCKAIL